MKKTSKIISVIIAVVMAVSCMSFGTTAFAASKTATISFKAKYNNAIVNTAMAEINRVRAQANVNPITVDANLTKIAKQRAADLCVYKSLDLPNGDSMSALLPNCGLTDFDTYGRLNYADAGSLANFLAEDCLQYSDILSIGVGVITVNGYNLCYYIISTNPASAVYTDYVDKNTTVSVNTLISNVKCYLNLALDSKYPRYNAKVTAYFPNGYLNSSYYGVDVTKQFTLSSSNKSVVKIKSLSAYPKKNGKVTITAKNKSNSALSASYSSFGGNFFKNLKVQNVSAKSTKKKTVAAKWAYTISDASGYEVQYSTDKKFKKNVKKVTVKGKKNTKKTLSKLKSKKTYYVRVRVYIDQGNSEKYYTGWSKTVTVKVK